MSLITSKVEQLFVFISICISSFVSQWRPLSIFLFEHVSSFYSNPFVRNMSYMLQIFSPKCCLTCDVIYGVFIAFGFLLCGLIFHCFLLMVSAFHITADRFLTRATEIDFKIINPKLRENTFSFHS